MNIYYYEYNIYVRYINNFNINIYIYNLILILLIILIRNNNL